ncbi:signal transduction histidine kinase [Krasilnikovia cinnamomea]|uniref:Signal transduction histidine-protein kinase/phosphatase MprB n=1 Tax=Krasilnikovia cinnamomea TaxID=349313 RepID=A0A4V2G7L5_9ACTN|nr:ATP-binding protein [Krasilnikovia cinnamomea]RZU52996.1 signal transduction histidine kinase [Krasilnikovia cinnamomea]
MRRRLTLLVAATTCLVLLAFLVPLALLVRQVAADRAVSGADDVVRAIVPLVGTSDSTELELSLSGVAVPVSVYLPDGRVLGAPAAETAAVRLARADGQSFTVDGAGGREIVVPVVTAQGTAVVRTVVPRAELTRGVTKAWLVLAGLGAALVLLGLLVADRLARTLVAPIAELSAVSHRLARAELSARASPAGPPELREVAGALNHLAGRIQDLLRQEREQVADLSHRLRTPLTALRLEAESLRDPDDAARVAAAADAIERAVTAVIREARHRGAQRPRTGCDATAVVADRVAFWSVLAEDTDRGVHRELPAAPLPVAVPADDLAAALDALLGNVFAHTPDGTDFGVFLTARPGGGAVLTVSDAGPGFAQSALRRGASGSGSTGLGMDIARQAAEASGGALRVETGRDGGARVVLELAGPA